MKAVILGGTGAVGTALVHELIKMPQITDILLLVRRKHQDPSVIKSSKVSQEITDVFAPEKYSSHLQNCSLAFNTFGVGQPTKTPKEEFVRVDYEAVKSYATVCKAAGVKHFSSLGSVGANRNSNLFYLKIKGDLEETLIQLKFQRLSLFRPSMIMTEQNRYGFSQGLALKFYPLLDPILSGGLTKYRSIKVKDLGSAMAQNAVNASVGPIEILQWSEIDKVLKSNPSI